MPTSVRDPDSQNELPLVSLCIEGRWVQSEADTYLDSINPATGDAIARVTMATRNDAQQAIEAARRATQVMRSLSVWDRAAMLRRIGDVLESKADTLARTISRDQGKPYATEAKAELDYTISGFHEAAEYVKWLESSTLPVADRTKRVFTLRQPRGVYAIVTPWNFPMMVPMEYLAPALGSGNAVVWVPAPTTSVASAALMECLLDADIPAGSVNMITGEGRVVGDEIVANPGTDAVGFTGSTATGLAIARRAAGKPMILELGGNGPVIILDDCDIDRAVAKTALSAYANAGQVCTAAERILVQESVAPDVIAGLTRHAASITLGDPMSPDTDMGPLNNEAVAAKMDRHVTDAVNRGAEVVIGGRRAPGYPTELFFEPTVVAMRDGDAMLAEEESFGPIAPVFQVTSDDEAIAMANAAQYGLTSAVFTSNLARAYRFIEELRVGHVIVNDTSHYWEVHLPHGGVAGKLSGLGKVGGRHALIEMTDLRLASIDVS